MASVRTQQTEGFVYWDSNGSGANPVAPYQCMSLANAGEVAAALAAGVRDAIAGRLVVPTPTGVSLGQTISARRIVGVSKNACFSGDEVLVQTGGVAEVMMNAAVAIDSMLFACAQATRTTAQTPLVNLPDMLLPADPRMTLTYQLAMADDPALTFDSTAANVLFYPLGFAMAVATNQYDVIPVQLQLGALAG